MIREQHTFIVGVALGLGVGLIAVMSILWRVTILAKLAIAPSNGSGEAHALLGKAAPDFQLDSLDGRRVDLAQHRDKEIVILDFWATWCPPCRRGLPKVARVATKYQERGVAFYAVDQGESAEEVRKFLTKERLEVPVLLDRDGAVGNLYQVDGIPQTVLVGKDGKIHVVHVGFSSDLESSLSRELDELLADQHPTAVNP